MATLPKRPKGVLSKGMGASNFVPGPYSKTGKDKFQDVVMAAMDTTETQKDRANIKSIIYSAGRKYKVDAAVVQKAAKAAEKMYAKKKPASKSADGSDTKPYNVRLIKPSEIIKDKPAAKKAAVKKAAVKKTAVKTTVKKKAGKK
jgi:DnaK suppressor protein